MVQAMVQQYTMRPERRGQEQVLLPHVVEFRFGEAVQLEDREGRPESAAHVLSQVELVPDTQGRGGRVIQPDATQSPDDGLTMAALYIHLANRPEGHLVPLRVQSVQEGGRQLAIAELIDRGQKIDFHSVILTFLGNASHP